MMSKLLPSLALCLMIPSLALADGAGDRVSALTEQGGSTEWDNKVKPIMLSEYDFDGSGWIDKKAEVDSIPCTTWKAADAGVRAKWPDGLRMIYGFQSDKIWLGYVLGFEERIRSYADAALAGCEASFGGGGGGGGVRTQPTGDAAAVPTAILAATPGQGGGDAWDATVTPIILAAHDSDGSGTIDTTEELMAMSCDTWLALDARVREAWAPYGLRIIYGFRADKLWVGNAIGVHEKVRSGADVRIASCLPIALLDGPTPTTGGGAPPVMTPPSGGGSVADQIRSRPEEGGGGSWDSAVKPILVGAYDLNGSGSIDNSAEVSSIPCDVWSALDSGVRSKWSYGLRIIYGFKAGYSWVGDAIGVHESVRTNGDSALMGCGLSGD
jgi:hypothetical protein